MLFWIVQNTSFFRYFFTLAHPRCHEHGHALRSSPQWKKGKHIFDVFWRFEAVIGRDRCFYFFCVLQTACVSTSLNCFFFLCHDASVSLNVYWSFSRTSLCLVFVLSFPSHLCFLFSLLLAFFRPFFLVLSGWLCLHIGFFSTLVSTCAFLPVLPETLLTTVFSKIQLSTALPTRSWRTAKGTV